jgi:hypothetical protein
MGFVEMASGVAVNAWVDDLQICSGSDDKNVVFREGIMP